MDETQISMMKKLYPLVTVDIALFTIFDMRLRVLLIKRANVPAPGGWALPGGILKPDEDRSLDAAARRVLISKTGVDVPHLEQLVTVSGPDRDPRGWSISTLYYALLPSDQIPALAGYTIEAIDWCDPQDPQHRLAFDHTKLLQSALAALRQKVEHGALPLHLLPEKFTLTDLQRTCEAIIGRPLDKGAFRRSIKNEVALLTVPGEFFRGPQRPAQIYRAAPGFEF
jgi:8-oxo-dGTP diphosphatase